MRWLENMRDDLERAPRILRQKWKPAFQNWVQQMVICEEQPRILKKVIWYDMQGYLKVFSKCI